MTTIEEFRLLTDSERTLAQQNGLDLSQVETDGSDDNETVDDYEKVRVYRYRNDHVYFEKENESEETTEAVTVMGRIYYPDSNFAEEFTELDEESLLLHELWHVFQQRSVVYAVSTGRDPDDYSYRDENGSLIANAEGTAKNLENFGAEAQAEIIGDRHRLCEGDYPERTRNRSDMTREEMYNDLNSIPGIPEMQTTCSF